jgi:hypothetical protein
MAGIDCRALFQQAKAAAFEHSWDEVMHGPHD